MVLFVVACAALGLLCVCANLLGVIGNIVVAALKYAVRPVVIFMLIMFAVYCMSRLGGV
ncbi:MAG: hypothetical protein IJS01_14005 [Lentisphaeria bacterium]|nr:hypothetical protein [Lentisphaeria bacterium]